MQDSTMRDYAYRAIKKKLQQMLDLSVFIPVSIINDPALKKPFPRSLFLKEKFNSED